MSTNNINLEYYRIENGGINIVFLNGFRMPYKTWDKVYPKLASEYSVLLFNRRGVGASSKANKHQDGKEIINEMRSFFLNLGLKPPYLLVAHSLGGIFANLYARVYPDEVSGVVFVDSPHPSEIIEQKTINPPIILSIINNSLKAVEKLFDKFKYSEDEYIKETINQIESAGSFSDIPIGVVSGTKKMPFVPEQAFDIHQRYQKKMLDLSPKSAHFICKESGHFPKLQSQKR